MTPRTHAEPELTEEEIWTTEEIFKNYSGTELTKWVLAENHKQIVAKLKAELADYKKGELNRSAELIANNMKLQQELSEANEKLKDVIPQSKV